MLRKLLAGACFALLAGTPAHAAKCYIREYSAIAQALSQPVQIGQEPAVADQVTADFAAGAVQSSAFNAATSVIRLWCDTQASFLIGANPTATANNAPLAALAPEFVGITPGTGLKLSVHTNP